MRRGARARRQSSPPSRFRPTALLQYACCRAGGRAPCGESAAHAQPGAARLTRGLRRGGRLAARRRGVGRRRDPVRARRDADPLRPAVLLPAADRAASSRSASAMLAAAADLPPPPSGLRALPDLPGYLRRARPPRARRRRARARRRALQAFLGAVWADATDFVFDAERFARRLRRARGGRLRRLRALGRAHAASRGS